MDESGEIFSATAASKAMGAAVGDKVMLDHSKESTVVSEVLPRKNILRRSFGPTSKQIGANLDRLLVVTAAQPLFNSHFIDRITTAANHENIPLTLVVNKSDLGLEETQPLMDVYRKLGMDILITAAKAGVGLEGIREVLDDPELNIAALSGMSGVGKSTILNRLVPEADTATREVSQKTGQGRQTTSQSVAYVYKRTGLKDLLLIDLPGVQNFGITHLSKRDVGTAMSEIAAASEFCEYHDCQHLAEPNCGVKSALEAGEIAKSRYESYQAMLEEIESVREY